MTKLVPYLFGALALIHVLPAMAVLMPSRLSMLYGFNADDLGLTTLLQHRALLFGLVVAALVYAIFNADVRWPVLIGTVLSMGGFIVIAAIHSQTSGPLKSIVVADVIGLVIAALAAFLLWKA